MPPALDYTGIYFNDFYQCYEPPIKRWSLAKLPSLNTPTLRHFAQSGEYDSR